MTAYLTETSYNPGTSSGSLHEVIDPDDFAYYVYLLNGEVREVAPATGLRLTNTELVFLLGEIVIARLPRRLVCFTALKAVAAPPLC